ncbi:MAG TPA: hypothetical protein PLG90_00035 [Ignavibacteria bacterium]|nr:hypothetical protein [Ignavibacteria bacterium]
MKRPIDTSHPLIDYLKIHKEKTIAGNKESYSIINYENGKFINHGGDTYPFEETYRNEIPEDVVISMLKSYYLYKCDIFNLKIPQTEQEWEMFLKENFYI